jgi:hypothetical protein
VCVHEGGDAVLVRKHLFGIGVPRPEYPADSKHPNADSGAEQQKNNDGQKVFRKISAWTHSILPAEHEKFELAGLVKRVHHKPTPQFCQAKQ